MLSLENNALCAAGGKALAEGLKGNQMITELNISNNSLGWTNFVGIDVSGVIALADVIPDMGALSKLIFGGDPDPYGSHYEPAVLEVGMTEADLNQKNLGVGGAIIISAWLTHKDNGALTTLDMRSNHIPPKLKEDIRRICAAGASGIQIAM
jgi:hypothetical protein